MRQASKLVGTLLKLFMIGVLVVGAYFGWRLYTKCQGKSLGACIWSFINPILVGTVSHGC
jgi:hypothetical protein